MPARDGTSRTWREVQRRNLPIAAMPCYRTAMAEHFGGEPRDDKRVGFALAGFRDADAATRHAARDIFNR